MRPFPSVAAPWGRAAILSLILSLAAAAGAVAAPPPDRRLALTVDDLPWVPLPEVPTAEVLPGHRRLVAAVARAGVPVVGFVNEGKLEDRGRIDPERLQMLRDWRDAGAELGNHSYGHSDLHAVGLAAYQADILRGERQLKALTDEKSQPAPRWFRHPYLRAGRSVEDKAALQAFLAEHGYRIAPVTVDNADWIWAGAYLRLDQRGDARLKARLRRDYLRYMGAKLDYYERQSIALLGYNLPQVWLIHANLLNADAYGELIAMARKRGYRFVGLDEALRDRAYQRADAYLGPAGPSWLHRWAIGERKPPTFFAGEPETPDWVLNLAGVESE
ncbi:polysaccharide deacetylase family protein [Lysobacter sp. BMK333-48F3]|uniref:polysaccharide deacetylase family protein n=1 Tax=Lysobacter sp. BMK333-48F3 TaxID=2867962 RepID=UPI001C8C537B|nr:polysaccharide deacetylase family protein [Lysobacter sp. BMK333-48F3]MBX9401573.1 polysaccharide deacetylase family protein [Lysobacter sp. BMK333-48F3]